MLVVDKPKYKMVIYEAKKELHVQVIGFLKTHIVEEYLKDLQSTIAQVQRQDFKFVVDATHQSPLPSKIVRDLGETMMFYTTLGFKEVWIVMPTSKIAQVQARNALERVKFPGFTVNNISQIK